MSLVLNMLSRFVMAMQTYKDFPQDDLRECKFSNFFSIKHNIQDTPNEKISLYISDSQSDGRGDGPITIMRIINKLKRLP